MQIFKHILFFFLALLICEGIAVGATAWSYLESSLAAFEQIRDLSDQRARDTIGAISKSSEGKLSPEKVADLNFAFHRLVAVTSADKEGFKITELSIVDDSGIVLASSNEKFLETPRAKRKPEEKFQSASYTSAHRLRKWQIGVPVLLDKQPVSENEKFLKAISPYFPEILQPEVLLSMAVYQENKLERVASLHMIYERGNFAHFVRVQSELFLWNLQNNAIVALICALILGFAHLLIKSIRTSFTPSGEYVVPPANPPLWEKVDFATTQGPVRWQGQEMTSVPDRSVPARNEVLEKAMPVPHAVPLAEAHKEKAEVLDAIYLG
ncbi:LIC_12071 family protein [Leptospira wolffii]|uniref:LIC_12071 family protein n=1 Tax=Leptospira wolffii TaxID=409998 RepID=UPI0002D542D5|nr:hypothetical protein [Leptospira wolffii]EPG67428.1 hypothetical protein LEP1GSC061_0323 [Leptospira wolffii serovar Khorat str. Khorat-H2]